METLSKTLTETKDFARRCLVVLKQNKPKGATVLGLSGDLGSGKTAFTQATAKILGIKEPVQSPTFVLMKIYPVPELTVGEWPWRRLVHLDCYRLESAAELRVLGWADLLADSANLILMEWPERVAGALPATGPCLQLAFVDENTRSLTFKHT